MKTHILSLALVIAALALGVSPTHAIVIDFESLILGGQGSTVSEDGFTLTTLNPDELFASGTVDSTGNSSGLGLTNLALSAVTELTRDGGGAFLLSSIDLSEHSHLTVFDVTFTGTFSGGGGIDQTFSLDGLLGSQTFVFSGFGSVTKVHWFQSGEAITTHQFDNIVASANNGNAVPEPASLGLLGLGLAGLALIRRGARQQRG